MRSRPSINELFANPYVKALFHLDRLDSDQLFFGFARHVWKFPEGLPGKAIRPSGSTESSTS